MNRFQALSIFNDYAFETGMTTVEMAGILQHWGTNFEGLGRWTINRIFDRQEEFSQAEGSYAHRLVLKAEDLSWEPSHQ
tara:strand:+ start:3797 stop:4033 length:237 start_codon:yes stop_codon:yes gene_type:complete